jgi:hypothetical protein
MAMLGFHPSLREQACARHALVTPIITLCNLQKPPDGMFVYLCQCVNSSLEKGTTPTGVNHVSDRPLRNNPTVALTDYRRVKPLVACI